MMKKSGMKRKVTDIGSGARKEECRDNRFDSGMGSWNLAEDADDSFGAVEFVFHEYFLLGKSKKYSHQKRCKSTRSGHNHLGYTSYLFYSLS